MWQLIQNTLDYFSLLILRHHLRISEKEKGWGRGSLSLKECRMQCSSCWIPFSRRDWNEKFLSLVSPFHLNLPSYFFPFSHPDSGPISSRGFLCVQCGSRHCSLPVECKVCKLTLVSAPQLARAFRYCREGKGYGRNMDGIIDIFFHYIHSMLMRMK